MDLGARFEDSFSSRSRASGAADPASPIGSSEFHAMALASARIGTWQLDIETGLAIWDAVAGELLRMAPPPREVGAPLPVHKDDREPLRTILERSLATGAPQQLEFRAIRADGEIRHLQGFASPSLADAGPGRWVTGMFYDITEYREGSHALAASGRQIKAIIDNLPGVAFRSGVNPPYPLSYISDAVEQLTGYSADDLLTGKVCNYSITCPEDNDAVTLAIAEAVASRTHFLIRYRIVRRSGEVRWVQSRGRAAYSETGEPIFLDGFIGDIHEQALAEQKLRETEERLRLVTRAAMELIWEHDLQTDQLICNEAFNSLGYCPDEIGNGRWWRERVHPDDLPRVTRDMHKLMVSGGSQFKSEHRFRRADGSYADIYACGYMIRDEAGTAVRIVGTMQDLTARKLADAALRESEALNRSIVEASTDCVVLLDHEGKLAFLNGACARAAGVDDPTILYGRDWVSLWPASAQETAQEAVAKAQRGGIAQFSEGMKTRSGQLTWWDTIVSPVLNDRGEPTKFVAILRDITDRKKAEEQLLRAATCDALTELPNRAAFHRTLEEAVAKAAGEDSRLGLLLLDLDEFKQVNDTLGHDAGDALLKAFAERLRGAGGEACWFARIGGDEFALVAPVQDEEELDAKAVAVLAQMRAPFVYAGRVLDCNATIGAAIFPDHAETPEELLKNADIALYAAKSSQRGSFVTFEPHHRAELQQRLSMIGIAREAVKDNRIVPFYQPKVALDDGSVFGFEALLRWHDAEKGIQLPAAITAAFHDLDVAAAISDRIIERVIADMRSWLDRDIRFGHVAVNAAAAEFRRDNFAEGVLERLDRAGIPPGCFQLEVTETVFLGRGAEYVGRALRLLSTAGVSIALDDFGTGYASLRQLKQFPVDVIKIDQSFVRDMESDPEDAAIIQAVLNLGCSLGIDVVAEGIETENQKEGLEALGCRFGQGFLFSAAVASEAVPGLLRSWKGRPRGSAPDRNSRAA